MDFDSMTDVALAALRDQITAEIARREAQKAAATKPKSQYYTDVRDGCVDQAYLGGFTVHKRGKNWVATVASDKTQPGGLRRAFWAKASGSWVHLPTDLKPGDVLEVAHEYTTAAGRCDKNRDYIKVVAVTDDTFYFDDAKKPS